MTGTFAVHDGTITVPSDDESGHPEVGLRIDAASFHTGTARRDTHVKSADFVDVEAHPFIEFIASSPVDDFDLTKMKGMAGRDLEMTVDLVASRS